MFGSKRRDPRVRDELHYHRDRLVQDYIAAGMDPASARRRAFLEFGNVASVEEQVRDARGRWVNDFAQDVRYRNLLLRAPRFRHSVLGGNHEATSLAALDSDRDVLEYGLPVRDHHCVRDARGIRKCQPNDRPQPLFAPHRPNRRIACQTLGS